MPVPKRKRSRARRDSRHANKFIKVKSFAACKNCEAALLPHQVCKNCGHYKGIKVMTPKNERAAKRQQTRQTQVASRQAKMQAMQSAAEGKAE